MTRFTPLTRCLLLVSTVAFTGCGLGAEPTIEETTRESAVEQTEEEVSREPAGPIVEDPRFELRAEATGPLTVGEPGTLRAVQLSAS